MQGHGRFCAQKLLPLKNKNDGLPRDSINEVVSGGVCGGRTDWTMAVDRPAAPASIAESKSSLPKHTTLFHPFNGHAGVYGNSQTVVFGDEKGQDIPKKYDGY
ncbi:hypothetical protein MAR_004076 [Mya arenaria]|uniref:Uncharacterized protein n=1 Tax=Mya arenaria TaxID=6604 RepID=A0ABY7EZ90_MYAAR|nr:hypothetical protein MAR_004076 [Mya arenaria]